MRYLFRVLTITLAQLPMVAVASGSADWGDWNNPVSSDLGVNGSAEAQLSALDKSSLLDYNDTNLDKLTSSEETDPLLLLKQLEALQLTQEELAAEALNEELLNSSLQFSEGISSNNIEPVVPDFEPPIPDNPYPDPDLPNPEPPDTTDPGTDPGTNPGGGDDDN